MHMSAYACTLSDSPVVMCYIHATCTCICTKKNKKGIYCLIAVTSGPLLACACVWYSTACTYTLQVIIVTTEDLNNMHFYPIS